MVNPRVITSILSALVHLDPFQAMGSGELGFLWIAKILNSNYAEDERYRMASQVVQSLGKYFCSKVLDYTLEVQPTWIPTLVDFLSLHEKFHTTNHPAYPRSIILRIPSTSPGPTHISMTILPILIMALSSINHLQLRSLALKVFHRSISAWFSSHMGSILNEDLDKLFQAIGDPFQPTLPPDHNPMMTVHQQNRPLIRDDTRGYAMLRDAYPSRVAETRVSSSEIRQ